jgi:hypothetical protein
MIINPATSKLEITGRCFNRLRGFNRPSSNLTVLPQSRRAPFLDRVRIGLFCPQRASYCPPLRSSSTIGLVVTRK